MIWLPVNILIHFFFFFSFFFIIIIFFLFREFWFYFVSGLNDSPHSSACPSLFSPGVHLCSAPWRAAVPAAASLSSAASSPAAQSKKHRALSFHTDYLPLLFCAYVIITQFITTYLLLPLHLSFPSLQIVFFF